MDIKTLVASVLEQIVEGVKTAQESSNKFAADAYIGQVNYTQASTVIEFDVPLKADGELRVLMPTEESAANLRIQFKIPIMLPTHRKPKAASVV